MLSFCRVDGNKISFKGITGCFYDEGQNEHSSIENKCREGYLLEIKMNFSKVRQSSDETKMELLHGKIVLR